MIRYKKFHIFILCMVIMLFFLYRRIEVYAVYNQREWFMAGANPQRTSWVSEEVSGDLHVDWYRVIEPFISHKVQVITANDTLFISTSKGLYALDASSGDEKWVFPTDLPLGHSPTVYNGKVYVGGLDHNLYALNAQDGRLIWKFQAEKGFTTNPLVISIDQETIVYAGNRDKVMYAIKDNGSSPSILWKYKADAPILFSAAASQDYSTIYFASNDNIAYALNAKTGALVWKSQKLQGSGFMSWWPVVYKDSVIFSGNVNYRTGGNPGPIDFIRKLELDDLWPSDKTRGTYIGSTGKEPGDWVQGTVTIDAQKIIDYLKKKPYRQTIYVLDKTNGTSLYIPPFGWAGTYSGSRYPMIVGGDGVLYGSNVYKADPYIQGGGITGWKYKTPIISEVMKGWKAVDEPLAYSAGGNIIYYNLNNDRVAGWFDISIPIDKDGRGGVFFSNQSGTSKDWLTTNAPGYREMYYGMDRGWPLCHDETRNTTCYTEAYGNINGIYGNHGDQNPPIPYKGRVYMIRSNAVLAFVESIETSGIKKQKSITYKSPKTLQNLSDSYLIDTLNSEVTKIINKGHLRPGYYFTGITDSKFFKSLSEYFHNPGDTLYVLSRAYPYVSDTIKPQLKTYLDQEYNSYSPLEYSHIGWNTGSPRESYILPDEVQTSVDSIGKKKGFDIFNFYALAEYAKIIKDQSEVSNIFTRVKSKLPSIPTDAELKSMSIYSPYEFNKYIAAYQGYLKLQKLAGESIDPSVEADLNKMLDFRVRNFSKDSPYKDIVPKTDPYSPYLKYERDLNIARNFMYFTKETGEYFRNNYRTNLDEVLKEYSWVAPYWFVSQYEGSLREGIRSPLYNYHALFQAKAYGLGETREELAPYLDVPAFDQGDLFYIDNLVALIEAPVSQAVISGDLDNDGDVDMGDLSILLSLFGTNDALADINSDDKVDITDLSILLLNFGQRK